MRIELLIQKEGNYKISTIEGKFFIDGILESNGVYFLRIGSKIRCLSPKSLVIKIEEVSAIAPYAGKACPRCWKGMNNETTLFKLKETVEFNKKRYGSEICNECAEFVAQHSI